MAGNNEIDPKIPRHQPAESMKPTRDHDDRPWFASDDDAPDGDAPDGGTLKQQDRLYARPVARADGTATRKK